MITLLKTIIKYFFSKYLCFKTNSIIKGQCKLNLNTVLEGNNVIYNNVTITNCSIGFGSYLGKNTNLTHTTIGRYCSIAENVILVVGRHPSNTFVSTHPAFFSTLKQAGFTYVKDTIFKEQKYTDETKQTFCKIGNDVWIGANVIITDGTIIGDGVIIATGAAVVSNLEPYYIYGGIPAKKIGNRFTEEERDFLMKFKWWEKDSEWIMNNAYLFSNIELFMNTVSKELNDGNQ